MRKTIKGIISIFLVAVIALGCISISFGEYYTYITFSNEFPANITNEMREQDVGIGEYFKLKKNELIAEDKITFHCAPGETIETNGESTYTFTHQRNFLGWRISVKPDDSTTHGIYIKNEDGEDVEIDGSVLIPDEGEIKTQNSVTNFLYSYWDDPVTITIPDAHKDGYVLLGWSAEKSEEKRYSKTSNDATEYHFKYTPGQEITVENTIDLYPVWDNTETKVVYHADDATSGTVPVDDTVYSSDNANATIKDGTDLKRDGWLFCGWNTSIDGYGCHFNPGDTLNTESSSHSYYDTLADRDGIIHLYAMWCQVNLSAVTEGVLQVGSHITYTFKSTEKEYGHSVSGSSYGDPSYYIKLTGTLPDGVKPDTSTVQGHAPSYSCVNGIYILNYNIGPSPSISSSSTATYNFECIVASTHADGTPVRSGDVLTAEFKAILQTHSNENTGDAYEINSVTNTVGGYQVNYIREAGVTGEDIADTNVYEENSTAVITDKEFNKDNSKFICWSDRSSKWKTPASNYYSAGDEITMTKTVSLYPVFGTIKEKIGESVIFKCPPSSYTPGATFTIMTNIEFTDGMSPVDFSCTLPDNVDYVSVKTRTPGNKSSTTTKHPHSLNYNSSTHTVSGTVSAPTVKDDDTTDTVKRHSLVSITVRVNNSAIPGSITDVPVTVTYHYNGEDYVVSDTESYRIDKGLVYVDLNENRTSSYAYQYENNTTIPNVALPNLVDNLFIGWNTEPDGSGEWYKPGDNFEFYDMAYLYALYIEFEQTIVSDFSSYSNAKQVIPEKKFTIKITVTNPYCDGEITVVNPVDPVLTILSVDGDGEISKEDNIVTSILEGKKGKTYHINIEVCAKGEKTYTCQGKCDIAIHSVAADNTAEAVEKLHEQGCTCSQKDLLMSELNVYDAQGRSAYYVDTYQTFQNDPRLYFQNKMHHSTWYVKYQIVKGLILSYDMNGAECAPPDDEGFKVNSLGRADMKVTEKTDFIRPGYKFTGWTKDPAQPNKIVSPGSSITAEKNMVLYAVWEETDEPPVEEDVPELPDAGSITLLLTAFISILAVGIYFIINKKFLMSSCK